MFLWSVFRAYLERIYFAHISQEKSYSRISCAMALLIFELWVAAGLNGFPGLTGVLVSNSALLTYDWEACIRTLVSCFEVLISPWILFNAVILSFLDGKTSFWLVLGLHVAL